MKFDITKRLREPPFGTETSERLLMAQAADEIDRLTRERDEAREAYNDAVGCEAKANVTAKRLRGKLDAAEDALAKSEQNAQGLASDLAGTQAELAETRERLEKVEAERRDRDSEIVILLANLRHMEEIAGETLEAEDAQMVSGIEAGLSSRRAALSTQESSAALAGDGKEEGR